MSGNHEKMGIDDWLWYLTSCHLLVCDVSASDGARDRKWYGLVPVTFLSSDGAKISMVAFPDVVGYIPAAGQLHPANDSFAFLLKEYKPDAVSPGMYDLYVCAAMSTISGARSDRGR